MYFVYYYHTYYTERSYCRQSVLITYLNIEVIGSNHNRHEGGEEESSFVRVKYIAAWKYTYYNNSVLEYYNKWRIRLFMYSCSCSTYAQEVFHLVTIKC